MYQLRLHQAAADIDQLALERVPQTAPRLQSGQLLIAVHAAGVNPSDVKAALGLMPHAVWPRSPGRDWAGVVQDGPSGWIGKEVWGSGGELGIRRDGSHAAWLVLEAAQVREKPAALSLLEAGGVGVPFITAYEGLRRAGLPQPGEVVLVAGANGKVGQAVIQLATRLGATVFGIERRGEPYRGHANGPVRIIDASREDVAAVLRDETGGHGADLVYNTVGSPYFAVANAAMAIGGRQVFISTLDRNVPFDIFAFYRGQHTYVGVDSLALDAAACARILDQLAPGFADGTLKPFPILAENVYSLAQAHDAYRAVLAGARERVLLNPQA